MKLGRRGFLAILGLSPIAAPLAAKEAVAKMGMSGIGGLQGGYYASSYHPESATSCAKSELSYLRGELAKMDDLMKSVREEADIRSFDPDLASMRSVSVSAGRSIQMERVVAKSVARRRRNLLERVRQLEPTGISGLI